MKLLTPSAIGQPLVRTEGPEKVTGAAKYSYEYDVEGAVYGWIVQSTIARGRITGLDDRAVRELPGVLDVLWHANAERLNETDDGELMVLQSADVSYVGQVVALVVATTLEAAREAASQVVVHYDEEPHDVVLRSDHPELYAPEALNAGFETDTEAGDVDAASASVTVDERYSTPALHNNPIEPHSTIARWDGERLTLWDSNQAPSAVATTLASMFDLPPKSVRVITQHVGGGFGSKGSPRPIAVLAALATRAVGRPVKVAATRQAMFSVIGYRTPTQQRVQLKADADGVLTAVTHATVEQTSMLVEFAEQTGESTRHMYAAPNRRVTHRLVRLDMPSPRWMRAPGECPGMYATESAMDELAIALGMDPVELRVRNDARTDPDTGTPFTSRHYVECLREGARRFGWEGRDPRPGVRRDGGWLVGTGVAGATYPANAMASSARVSVDDDGHYVAAVAAADIGQGARTVLRQIAADALDVPLERVTVELGDSALPKASVAGGSTGTSSWGWAITEASRQLRAQLGRTDGIPAGGAFAEVDLTDLLGEREQRPRYAYGAHFVEVGVNADTGEVRLRRALGIFAVGRVMNPRTARSQLIGGMSMGISMALMEEGRLDPAFGDWVNHDLAEYHVVTNADIPAIEVDWLEEFDDDLNPMGGKGIGEIGIVGTAAAVTNAIAHATGVRIRDLPARADTLLMAMQR